MSNRHRSRKSTPVIGNRQVRHNRLKNLYEGRCRQLDAIRSSMIYPYTFEINFAYSKAVIKYDRARRAWRAFRGWS